MCRSAIKCKEGEELWQLTSIDASDLESYINDLVARVYEQFKKLKPLNDKDNFVDLRNSQFADTVSEVRRKISSLAVDGAVSGDLKCFLSVVSLDEQIAAEKQILSTRRDREIAEYLSYKIDEE